MMDQEITSLPVLEIPGCISDFVRNDTSSSHRVKMSESDDDTAVSCEKERSRTEIVHQLLYKEIPRRGKRFSSRTERKKGRIQHSASRTPKKTKEDAENIANGPTKTTVRKPDQIHRNIKGSLNTCTAGRKTHINTSDVIIDQFTSQSGDNIKKCIKETSRRFGKPQSHGANASGSQTKVVRNTTTTTTTRPSRKLTRSSLRRLKKLSVQKSKVRERSASISTNFKELVGDKAENNNWMIDTEEASSGQGGLVVPTFHTKSRASSFNSFIQPNSGRKTISRAASSDDSGGCSNLPLHSSNSMSTERRDCYLEGNSQAGGPVAGPNGSLNDSKLTPIMCTACGNEPQRRGYALCKNCSIRIGQDGNRNGPLDELKAYAQSIANSVKKILLISPGLGENEEIIHNSVPNLMNEDNTKVDDMRITSGADVPLHRYMTELNMANSQEARSKSLLNKSVSYDGRVGACLEEKGRRSSMDWISQEKVKASDSLSKISDSNIYMDEDYFALGKECKHFLVHDSDKNSRTGRTEKPRTKISMKQLARVERARTDGDLRTNPLQQSISNKKQGKDDHKKGYEFHRNRSKTFHEADADSDEQDSCSQNYQEETGDIDICRLKVIHEGTPVDPPYTLDTKKSEDGKSRKAVFIRSATAPYKNHVSRRDIASGDKLGVMEGAPKSNRSNTKITVRTNKASTLRKENSLNDKKKGHEFLDSNSESWRDDTSVIATMSFTRRRSTSYDGSQQMHPKRDELHRSISWSVIEGDDEGSKQRREAASAGNMSMKRNREHGAGFSVNTKQPSKFPVRARKEHRSKRVMSTDPFLQKELSMDNFRYHAREPSSQELSTEISKDMILPDAEEHVELMLSQNKSYFDGMKYYDHGLEKQLSPCMEEEEVLADDECDMSIDKESYYCYTEPHKLNRQLGSDVLQSESHSANAVLNSSENELVYHDQINKYADSETAHKGSPWYSPIQISSSNERALVQRDRSLESKSSTSFHLVITAKSSHSDEVLMKYSGTWEHAPSRRQSMYTETDVDTGVIYHLAKRQTTRAHVPPYRDLTSVSRDIYTMSGDVSTSTSSNSAISTRSEISECAYTGGFYREEPFYESDSKGSRSSSSGESSSHIYFESNGISKRETSELDIYTGSIFNSKQNTLSLAQDANKTELATEAGKDGSVNNSSRSAMGRMQRSVRYRPRIDTISVRSNDSAWECLSKQIVACGENKFCNISNNSNNWYEMDDFEGSFNQGSIVTKSKEPLYTDYDPGMRPEFHVRTIEKTGPVFDFLKYENIEEANKTFFSPPQKDNSSNDSIWYSGLLHGQRKESSEKRVKRLEPPSERSMLSWQYYDDYYTSNVRPIINKTNNCDGDTQEKTTWDTNNNHFDDIYTGTYGAQNVQASVHEQPAQNRQPPPESFLLSQPTPKHTSATFYDQSYESCYTMSPSPRASASPIFEPPKEHFPSSPIFRRDSSFYSEPSPYMADDGWRKYEQSNKTFVEPKRQRPLSLEKPVSDESDSYFNYVTNKSPDKSFYITDDDTYSFEQKCEKKTPEIPVVHEIKTVGGIVCRENVANKEDYAEDINRDLEPAAWVPFSFRRDEESRHPMETGGSHDKSDIPRASEIDQGQNIKHLEDSPYAHNRLYDVGARNKWRENRKESDTAKSKETAQHRALQSGDTGKLEHGKSAARSSPDIIPDRARGKRITPNVPKPMAADSSSINKGSGSTSFRNKLR